MGDRFAGRVHPDGRWCPVCELVKKVDEYRTTARIARGRADNLTRRLNDHQEILRYVRLELESHQTMLRDERINSVTRDETARIARGQTDKLQARVDDLEDRFSEELACPVCHGEGEVECRNCMHPVPYDCGQPLTCTLCKDGKVPCEECVKEVRNEPSRLTLADAQRRA